MTVLLTLIVVVRSSRWWVILSDGRTAMVCSSGLVLVEHR